MKFLNVVSQEDLENRKGVGADLTEAFRRLTQII